MKIKLLLLQNSVGERKIIAVEEGVEFLDKKENVKFETLIFEAESLLGVDFYEASETVLLQNGGKFFVESNLAWLTSDEFEDIFILDNVNAIRWNEGIKPVFSNR